MSTILGTKTVEQKEVWSTEKINKWWENSVDECAEVTQPYKKILLYNVRDTVPFEYTTDETLEFSKFTNNPLGFEKAYLKTTTKDIGICYPYMGFLIFKSIYYAPEEFRPEKIVIAFDEKTNNFAIDIITIFIKKVSGLPYFLQPYIKEIKDNQIHFESGMIYEFNPATKELMDNIITEQQRNSGKNWVEKVIVSETSEEIESLPSSLGNLIELCNIEKNFSVFHQEVEKHTNIKILEFSTPYIGKCNSIKIYWMDANSRCNVHFKLANDYKEIAFQNFGELYDFIRKNIERQIIK